MRCCQEQRAVEGSKVCLKGARGTEAGVRDNEEVGALGMAAARRLAYTPIHIAATNFTVPLDADHQRTIWRPLMLVWLVARSYCPVSIFAGRRRHHNLLDCGFRENRPSILHLVSEYRAPTHSSHLAYLNTTATWAVQCPGAGRGRAQSAKKVTRGACQRPHVGIAYQASAAVLTKGLAPVLVAPATYQEASGPWRGS